ncbi:MAG: DUF378 domain-containing protein [Halanaeroarchaeum sp.]
MSSHETIQNERQRLGSTGADRRRALNWGLVGIAHFVAPAANWNLVSLVLGTIPALEFAVYLLVGLADLYRIYFASRIAGVETAGSCRLTEAESYPRRA